MEELNNAASQLLLSGISLPIQMDVTADMGVTLEIMHTLPDPDFRAYFINWARVWCRKAKEEYLQLLLSSDVHSPGELRANMQPRNFAEWYEAFGVTEHDGMYIAPEKRISIW